MSLTPTYVFASCGGRAALQLENPGSAIGLTFLSVSSGDRKLTPPDRLFWATTVGSDSSLHQIGNLLAAAQRFVEQSPAGVTGRAKRS